MIPLLKEDSINIIIRDFNTNLYLEKDRTSEVAPQRDNKITITRSY